MMNQMNQINEILIILQNAMNPDQSVRNKAEKDIKQLADNNFGIFLLNMALIISNEGTNDGARQLSATIIKNMIINEQYAKQWFQIPQETRVQIKQNVLSTLASSKNLIRKAAGIAIAGICKIDLPSKQWNDIFTILAGTCTNNQLNIQLSSVITLGYIFQEISNNDMTDDDKANVLNAFYTILNNSNSNIELIKETLISINNFNPFISCFLHDEKQRMLFFQLIERFVGNPDPEIRKLSYLIFLELVRNYYDCFKDYIKKLSEITLFCLQKDTPGNMILGYEIWYAVSSIETARLEAKEMSLPCMYYCQTYFPVFKDIIFNNLFTNQFEEDEWTLSKATAALITSFCECCSYDNMMGVVVDFIGKYINDKDEYKKHAGIRAFSCIIETNVHHNKIIDIVKNSIEVIGGILHDSNTPLHLKIVCSEVIEKICKYFGEEVINDYKYGQKLFSFFINTLNIYPLPVLQHLCTAIHFLANSVPRSLDEKSNNNTNILSEFLSKLLTILGSLAFNTNNYNSTYNVTLSAFFAIGSLAERAAFDTLTIRQSFFDNMLQALKEACNPKNFQDEEMRYNYISYITTTISSFLISSYIDPKKTEELFKILINIFMERQKVFDEGISLIGSIAISLEENFDKLFPSFLPILIDSLGQVNNQSLCKSAIICTSDIIRSINANFNKYIHQVFPCILNILNSPIVDKSLKPFAFNVLSDLFYSSAAEVSKYFSQIMDLIGSAMQATASLYKKQQDIDTYEYFMSMREHIIEALTCILFSFTEGNYENNFGKYVQPVMTYLNTVCSKEFEPTYDMVKNSVGLIGDLCMTYKKDMKSYISKPVIEYMVSILKNPPKYEDRTKIASLYDWLEQNLKEFS